MLSIVSQQLGPVYYPLIICSVIACIITLERFIVLARESVNKRVRKEGLVLLVQNKDISRELSIDAASVWLNHQRKKLSSGLAMLQVVVVLAPLLGLFGTVVGLMKAFTNISKQSGPIEVSILSEGLGIAMSTTAAGLAIAMPALVVMHLYKLWVERLVYDAELKMNQYTLNLDNVRLPISLKSVK